MTRREIEDKYWVSDFLPWYRQVNRDPRNGEHIDTIFWYWYANIAELDKEQS